MDSLIELIYKKIQSVGKELTSMAVPKKYGWIPPTPNLKTANSPKIIEGENCLTVVH